MTLRYGRASSADIKILAIKIIDKFNYIKMNKIEHKKKNCKESEKDRPHMGKNTFR